MANEFDAGAGFDKNQNEQDVNHNSVNNNSPDGATPLNRFLYVHPSLHLEGATLNDIIFNYNLQEFSTRVSFLCGLEQGGKLSPEQALNGILGLWKGLKQMRREFYPRKDKNEKQQIDTASGEDMEISPQDNTIPAQGETVPDIADYPASNRVPLNEAEISRAFYLFSSKVSLVCSLIAGGKIAPLKGYKIIKKHWRNLRGKFGF